MSDFEYSNESYCAICDLYFSSVEDRAEHVEDSADHPRCDTCKRRFLNGNNLRNHYVYSRYHHYCASCRVSFDTAAGLRMHIEHSSVHGDDSDDEDDDLSSPTLAEGEEDEMGRLRYSDEDSDLDSESGEYSDDDSSFEHFDECDFEDEEDLGDKLPYETVTIVEEEDEEENEDGVSADEFSCPICNLPPNTVCSTTCGHLFCTPCIKMVYDIQGACPICDAEGTVEQLRKVYIST
ncbi:putative zinc-finger-containing protein [Lyophyllum atratum]|nr:putative zinc-finger-containing protein [Lyophyllum atratum]